MTSDATHAAHGAVEASPVGAPPDEHAAIYETAGISEGHAPVPRWMIVLILSLFAFWGWYVVTQWGAQSSTAQNHK